MLRYMMTPTQAIELILKANELAQGGEVFVLKMPIIKLQDLADVMIEEMKRLYEIREPIEIKVIGLRPGEKRFEELMTEDEYRICIETEHMYILPPPYGGKSRAYKGFVEKRGKQFKQPIEKDAISKETLRKWIIEEDLI